MNRCLLTSLGALALASVWSTASAQTTSASTTVGASNRDYLNQDGFTELYGLDHESSNGSAVTASVDRNFTGLDSENKERTMNFTASSYAQANFGRLRARAESSLTNTYYNAGNDPFYNSNTRELNEQGSPDLLASLAFAGFTDTLQYGGELQSGYKAKYVFFVHGHTLGSPVLASLNVKIAGDVTETFYADIKGPGPVGQYFTTNLHDIAGTFAQDVKVDFSAQVNISTSDYPDGSDVYGLGDFTSTATLTGIQVFDQNGNEVTNFTVSSASGTQYPIQVVPEPASLAALSLGALLVARRRRSRAK